MIPKPFFVPWVLIKFWRVSLVRCIFKHYPYTDSILELSIENLVNLTDTIIQQDSPPAWTQEAYRPQRISYSIRFPIRGGGGRSPTLAEGYLHWLGGGYLPWDTPLSWPGQGGTYLGWGVPTLGYIPSSWPDQGCTYLGQGVPTLGYPPV